MRNAILCAAAVAALSTSMCFASDGSDPNLSGGGPKVEAVEPPAEIVALPADLADWTDEHRATFNAWFDGLPENDATPYKLGEGSLVEAFTARKEEKATPAADKAKAPAADKAKPPAADRAAKASKDKETHIVWVAPGYESYAIGQLIRTTPENAAALQATAKARMASDAEVADAKKRQSPILDLA